MAMPAQRAPDRRWTEEDFYAARDAAPPGERWELVDGQVLVTPAPHWVHQRLIGRLFESLAPYVRAHGLGEAFVSPLDVELEPGLVLQPDLLVVPVGALWVDGAYYVTTGQGTVKGNNLDHNPYCVITRSSRDRDLVFEGEAAKVSEVEKLERIARAFADWGWPAYVHDGVLDAPYSAPWTGSAPYDVYEVTPTKVLALHVGEDNINRGTRYRF